MSENLWEDEKYIYTFGNQMKMAKKSTPNPVAQAKEEHISVTPWYERISIKQTGR
jgi:hypothetical protein